MIRKRSVIIAIGIAILFFAIIIQFYCSQPIKPDFDIPPDLIYTLFSDSGSTDTLGQGSAFSCQQTVHFFMTLGMPHEVTNVTLSLKDSIGNTLYADSSSSIDAADSTVSLGSYTFLYPGSDTISLTVMTEDTTVNTSFVITVAGLAPVIGGGKNILPCGKKIVDSLFCLYVPLTGTRPILVQWYKDSAAFASGFDKDTLVFIALSLADSGVYYCTVTNDWGSDASIPYTLTTIASTPQILDGGTMYASGTPLLGAAFYLYVKGVGSTPLQYTWSHNGVLITGAEDDTLHFLSPLAITDTGAYVCTLSNVWGTDVSVPYNLTFGNQPPQWRTSAVSGSVYEGGRFVLSFTDSCSDPDNDVISFTLAPQEPPGDTITQNGVYSFSPTYTDAGQYEVAILAGDGMVYSPCMLSLTVHNSNRRPVFADNMPELFYAIEAGAQLSITYSATDPDGEDVIFSIASTTLPRAYTIAQTSSTITWQSYESDTGRYNLVLHATDGIDTAVVTIDITVGAYNLPPNITIAGYQSGDTMAVNERDTLSFTVAVADPNTGDVAILAAPLNKPDSAHFNITTGAFLYVPNYQVSTAQEDYIFGNITFTATDNATPPLADTFVVHIRVVNTNDAPVLDSIDDQTVYEGDSLLLTVSASDINGDSVNLRVESMPDSAQFTDWGDNTGLFAWKPAYTDSGVYSVSFVADDGEFMHKIPVTISVLDKKYTIIASAGEHGTIAPVDTIITEPLTTPSFAMTPDDGYHIDSILVDGVNAGTDSIYTFAPVDTNHTIEAFFSINIYEVRIGCTRGKGLVQVNSGNAQPDTVNLLQHGTALTLVKNNASGFQFSAWKITYRDGIDTFVEDSTLQITVLSHMDILLEFVRTGMVLIPAKDETFQMGQTGVAVPVHAVTFSHNFWMDETEVIVEDYVQLIGVNPAYHSGSHGLPVENLSFYDAALYCNERSKRDSLDTVYTYTAKEYLQIACTNLADLEIHYDRSGYRLPTEAEWEFACRGGTTTPYYWGADSITGLQITWNIHVSNNITHPVKQLLPNGYGLYDMAGNVWEKCNDWLDTYPDSAQTDPIGPELSPNNLRVARGSCYASPLRDMQSAMRGYNVPNTIYYFIGFRVVKPQSY